MALPEILSLLPKGHFWPILGHLGPFRVIFCPLGSFWVMLESGSHAFFVVNLLMLQLRIFFVANVAFFVANVVITCFLE